MDWYRSTTWTDDDASLFESKLSRARSWSRPQYLRIQGIVLTEQSDPDLRAVGRGLLRRVIDEFDGDREATSAAEMLGDSFRADGLLDEAVHAYVDALRRIETGADGRNGTSWATELWLAETLIERGGPEDLDRAAALLDVVQPEIEQHAIVREHVFRYLVARAQVSERLDAARATEYARAALEVLDESTPSLLERPIPADDLVTHLRRLAKNG